MTLIYVNSLEQAKEGVAGVADSTECICSWSASLGEVSIKLISDLRDSKFCHSTRVKVSQRHPNDICKLR